MSESLQLMLASFDKLADSIRQVSIGNSIERAQGQVDAIRKSQGLNEFEKIKAQQALAQTVGTEVIKYGGSASMAQNAMASLAPNIPDARMASLEATGAGTLAEAQQVLQDKADQRQLDAEKRVFEREKILLEMRNKSAENMFGLKTDAKQQQPLDRKSLEALSKPAQMASQWQQIAAGAAKFGKQLLTPEALGSNERAQFERVKAATESKARADLFGASLTTAEAASFDQIRGSLLKAGLSGEQYSAGFKALGDLQKQVYVRTLNDYSVGKVGTQEQLLRHLASNKGLFNKEELKNAAIRIKAPNATDMSSVEADLGVTSAAPGNAPAGAVQQAPAGLDLSKYIRNK